MIKRFHSNLFFASDLEKTTDFYTKLGFEVAKAEGAIRMKLGDFTLAIMDEKSATIQEATTSQPRGAGMFLYVEVDDVDEQYRSITKEGISSTEPKDWPWGKREFVVKDPDGYHLVFFAPIKK